MIDPCAAAVSATLSLLSPERPHGRGHLIQVCLPVPSHVSPRLLAGLFPAVNHYHLLLN